MCLSLLSLAGNSLRIIGLGTFYACKFTAIGVLYIGKIILKGILYVIGFSARGIIKGSYAAGMMSYFTIMYGGQLIAGGVVSTLQSIATIL